MEQFFLDKDTKVPLYLQLKDQIKYFISTGVIKSQERLPPVKSLAQKLGINFLTVRKAYKELENEGLLAVKHGDGCYVRLHNLPVVRKDYDSPESFAKNNFSAKLATEARELIERFLTRGVSFAEVRQTIEKNLTAIERAAAVPTVVFTECNQFQVKEISQILERQLNIPVKSFLITELAAELPALTAAESDVHIITTGFHVNEIREAVGDLPAQIDVLITNLNPETRRKLESVGEKAKYGFICRDRESSVLYKDLLKAELGFQNINLTSCTLAETEKVNEILETAEIILTSPPVYEDVKKRAAPHKSVFNLFERVDPMSLKVIKDRILARAKQYEKN